MLNTMFSFHWSTSMMLSVSNVIVHPKNLTWQELRNRIVGSVAGGLLLCFGCGMTCYCTLPHTEARRAAPTAAVKVSLVAGASLVRVRGVAFVGWATSGICSVCTAQHCTGRIHGARSRSHATLVIEANKVGEAFESCGEMVCVRLRRKTEMFVVCNKHNGVDLHFKFNIRYAFKICKSRSILYFLLLILKLSKVNETLKTGNTSFCPALKMKWILLFWLPDNVQCTS